MAFAAGFIASEFPGSRLLNPPKRRGPGSSWSRLEDHVERCLRRPPEAGEAAVVDHHLPQPLLAGLRA